MRTISAATDHATAPRAPSPRTRSGPSPSRSGATDHSNAASVFASAQFARPPWIEAIESTAMKGIDDAGSGRRASSTGEASTSL